MLISGRDVALIFADIRLPGVMDGIDLAREVRMRWPLLPVILTSGHPRDDQLPPLGRFYGLSRGSRSIYLPNRIVERC